MNNSFIKLLIDGRENPVAVGRESVRLSVKTAGVSGVKGFIYRFYRSVKDVENNKPFLQKKTLCRYAYFDGEEFSDCKKYYCSVAAKTDEGEIRSDSVEFTTAISRDGFTAKWIENPVFDGHVSEFKKDFTVKEKVKTAFLYIVGLGFYDAYLNGNKTDQNYFKPVLTDFDRRLGLDNPNYPEENFDNGKYSICYDVYDVKELLISGRNTLTCRLGTGWYCNTDKDITDPSYTFGTPKLIFELHIETDSSVVKIISDGNCSVRNTSVISQMFKGDRVDFSAEPKDFMLARVCTPPAGKLRLNPTENDEIKEIIKPIKTTVKDGAIEYDFGKNHTGSLRIKIKGKKGDKVFINYYETEKDGELNPLTSRWLAYKNGVEIVGHLDQCGEYVLSGGEDLIEPLYHWNCYRYARLSCPENVEIFFVESLFISSGVKEDMIFDCTDEDIKKIHDAFVLTQKDNMHCGVPSDCPTREKLPYTGDGQLAAESASYCFDLQNFYRKWLADIIESQGKNGFVAYTAPIIAGGGGYWWSNALVVLPFVIYNMTGDKTVLEEAIEPCKRLVEYYLTCHTGDFIVNKSYLKWFLGEWCTPDEVRIDKFYVNTLAAYYAAERVQEMCRILNDAEGAVKYGEIKEKFRQAINRRYFDKDTCDYATGIQGANIMPVLYGIADSDVVDKIAKKIVSHYKKTACFDTGIIMTPALLDMLSLLGEYELGYKLLTAKKRPSYAYMLDGQTTLSEHWFKDEINNGNVSFCHPMFGSVTAWIYKNIAGVDLSKLCENIIEFSPKLIRVIGMAKFVKDTAWGKVVCEYSVSGGIITLNIIVPYGITARMKLPFNAKTLRVNNAVPLGIVYKNGFSVFELSGGKYRITAKI